MKLIKLYFSKSILLPLHLTAACNIFVVQWNGLMQSDPVDHAIVADLTNNLAVADLDTAPERILKNKFFNKMEHNQIKSKLYKQREKLFNRNIKWTS